ncbi:MAG: DoxX family protein [Candidatus Micrarchaeota archaeon]|nr:DoxX family protein [Candidatus Micrarchaeota archaeon]
MAGKVSFFERNAIPLKSIARILFGGVWLIDAYFKFLPNFAQNFSNLVASTAQGQPAWFGGWFAFWVSVTSSNPALWAYIVAFSELALAICLIFGFMRKVGYSGGILLSLLIWAIPEGFGGPYGPSSTDIGTGVIYAIVFLMLIVINATAGPSRYSVDYYLEKRFKWWKKLAEF